MIYHPNHRLHHSASWKADYLLVNYEIVLVALARIVGIDRHDLRLWEN